MLGEKLIAAVALAMLVTGATGCGASGTEAAGPAAVKPQQSRSGGALQAAGTVSAAAAPAIVPATMGSSQPRPTAGGSPTAGKPATAGGSPTATSSPTASQGPSVYLAEGQDVHGTITRAPGCASGCPLSGDGTVVLYGMTWREWTGTQAIGTGTEEIQDCVPNCAAGPHYKVPVIVTLAAPKKDCASSGATTYVWTKAAFRWPDGLPSGLRGPDAPYNPWTFTALEAQLGCG
jgi:hypothetical protein